MIFIVKSQGNMKSRLGKRGERRLSCVPVVGLRGANGPLPQVVEAVNPKVFLQSVQSPNFQRTTWALTVFKHRPQLTTDGSHLSTRYVNIDVSERWFVCLDSNSVGTLDLEVRTWTCERSCSSEGGNGSCVSPGTVVLMECSPVDVSQARDGSDPPQNPPFPRKIFIRKSRTSAQTYPMFLERPTKDFLIPVERNR